MLWLTWLGMRTTADIYDVYCMACADGMPLLLREDAGTGPREEPGHTACII